MAQYRLLTQEELQALEKEFVEFLVVNGLTGPDWENLKKETPQKAEKFLDLFSDVVFEGVMRKTQFLEYRSEREIKTFHCLENKIVLVGLSLKDGVELNLLNLKDFTELVSSSSSQFEVYTTEKEYNKKREVELFEMTQSGCEISDGNTYKAICMAL